MDIARLSGEISFEAPGIGAVRVSLYTVGFLRWYNEREAAGGWRDAEAFVRRLLKDRAVPQGGDAKKLDPTAVDRMSHEDVEAVATAALDQAQPASGADRRLSDGAESDDGTRPASMRLLSLVRARAERSNAQTLETAAKIKKQMDSLAIGRSHFKSIESLSSLSKSIGGISAAARAVELTRSPAYEAAAGLALKHDQISRLFAPTALSVFRDRKSVIDEIVKPSFIAQNALSGRGSRLDELVRGTTALRDAFPALGFAREANSLFSLGLSRPALQAIAGTGAFAALRDSESLAILKMAKPGFGLTAALGIDLAGPRGVVADVLNHYDEADLAPVFGAVTAAPATLDETIDVERIAAAIELAWNRISIALAATPKTDRVTITGLLTIATFLIALWSAVLGQLTYNASSEAPTKTQMEQVHQDIARSHEDALATNTDHDRFIRYLDQPASLRAEPDGHAMPVRRVYPDQLVRVRETRGRWALVEVYDYQSDQPISGWLNRAHLRRGPA
jgi:hypothetical protein